MFSNGEYIELLIMLLFWACEWLFLMIFRRSAAVGEIKADLMKRLFAIILKTFILEHTID